MASQLKKLLEVIFSPKSLFLTIMNDLESLGVALMMDIHYPGLITLPNRTKYGLNISLLASLTLCSAICMHDVLDVSL